MHIDIIDLYSVDCSILAVVCHSLAWFKATKKHQSWGSLMLEVAVLKTYVWQSG